MARPTSLLASCPIVDGRKRSYALARVPAVESATAPTMQPSPIGDWSGRRGEIMIVLKMLLAAIAFVLLIGPLNAHANIIYN
jgi:hypothetical protein